MLVVDGRPPTTEELRTAPTELSRAVGAALRAVMEQRGLNQKELAELVGVPRTVINQIMSGKQNMTLTRLEHLFNRLGYTLDMAPRELKPKLRRSQKRAREGLL